ncbi:MAG: hypothetical protein IK020_10760 [Clostridiales bacterium]|nr:hypothetical protein [Clostridiales bacterium]
MMSIEPSEQNRIHVTLAGEPVEVHCLYPQTVDFLASYRSTIEQESLPDPIRVAVVPEELEMEQIKSDRERQLEGLPVHVWEKPYLEQLAVYRKIADEMPKRNVILFHGSVIAVDGEGYLFTAVSGTGKSTHTRLWREYFGGRAEMINDDKPLIRIEEGAVLAYGTPWDGKHHLSTNKAVPLKAICFLDRGAQNEIHPIDPMEKYPTLLQQIYRPKSVEGLTCTMHLIDLLMKETKFYHLHCNMDIEAAEVAWKGMH